MRATVSEITKKGNLTLVSLGNGSVIEYSEPEYENFRKVILNLTKPFEIKKLTHLKGLCFDWLVSDKPYPYSLVLPDYPIYVDSQEPQDIFEGLLPMSVGKSLNEGDYKFRGYVNGEYGDILIERKASEDLVNSVCSGHLSEQVNKMATSGALAIILLVEDYLSVTIDGRIKTRRRVYKVGWDFVWNHLHTLQQENGLLLDSSPNLNYTPRRLKLIYERYQDPEHKSNRIVQSFGPSLNLPQRVLATFPGYGEGMVKKVSKNFGSLRDYFNASVEQRKVVDKVGSVLASKIDEVLDEVLDKDGK